MSVKAMFTRRARRGPDCQRSRPGGEPSAMRPPSSLSSSPWRTTPISGRLRRGSSRPRLGSRRQAALGCRRSATTPASRSKGTPSSYPRSVAETSTPPPTRTVSTSPGRPISSDASSGPNSRSGRSSWPRRPIRKPWFTRWWHRWFARVFWLPPRPGLSTSTGRSLGVGSRPPRPSIDDTAPGLPVRWSSTWLGRTWRRPGRRRW